MTIIIQHNLALGTTTSRAIYDVNGNDNYFYASRRDLMMEIFFIICSIPFANSRFETLWTQDFAAETFYISNSESNNNDYVVKLRVSYLLLHKHHFYFYMIDFAMKRLHSACATASLNAVKIACKFVVL